MATPSDARRLARQAARRDAWADAQAALTDLAHAQADALAAHERMLDARQRLVAALDRLRHPATVPGLRALEGGRR